MDLKQDLLNRVIDNPNILKELTDEERDDFDTCATALLYSTHRSYHCIRHVSDRLKNDVEFMLLAVDRSPYYIFHAGPDALDNLRVIRRACCRAKTDLMFFFCLVVLKKVNPTSLLTFAKRSYNKKFYQVMRDVYVDDSMKDHAKIILQMPRGTYAARQIAKASGLTLINSRIFLRTSPFFKEIEVKTKKKVALSKRFVYEKIL